MCLCWWVESRFALVAGTREAERDEGRGALTGVRAGRAQADARARPRGVERGSGGAGQGAQWPDPRPVFLFWPLHSVAGCELQGVTGWAGLLAWQRW